MNLLRLLKVQLALQELQTKQEKDVYKRQYIDRLMPEAAITEEEQKYLDGMLMVNAYDPDKLLSCVSQLLANTSKSVSYTHL